MHQADNRQMVKHIEHVRVLSDLLIEAETPNADPVGASTDTSGISEEEMKAMIGGAETKKISEAEDSKAAHDDANGKSIFDF